MTLKILILNGANLDLLGSREPEIYGSASLVDLEAYLRALAREWSILRPAHKAELSFVQSNHEGVFLDVMSAEYDGFILNPGAWTHTSVAILDRVRALNKPTIEVHLSHLAQREDYRKHSFLSQGCTGTITGLGFDSYGAALWALLRQLRPA